MLEIVMTNLRWPSGNALANCRVSQAALLTREAALMPKQASRLTHLLQHSYSAYCASDSRFVTLLALSLLTGAEGQNRWTIRGPRSAVRHCNRS